MSDSNSDKGWTFVNDDNDTQPVSDDGSSSSSDFVHMDGKEAMSYHHKSRCSSVDSDDLVNLALTTDQPGPRETNSRDSSPELLDLPENDVASSGAVEGTPEPHVDDPEALDEPQLSDPELLNSEGSEPDVLDREVVSALTCTGEGLDKAEPESPVSTSTLEPRRQEKDGAMTDSLESLRDFQSTDGSEDGDIEADVSADNDSMEYMAGPTDRTDPADQADSASGSSGSSIEHLNMSDDSHDAEGVVDDDENSQPEMSLPPAGITNLKKNCKAKLSDSDSEFSDIVKIDHIPREEIPSTSAVSDRRSYFRAVDLMQVSASSSSSGNSNLSSRFHFVHPLPGNHRYVYPREEEEDVQSLPGDVDDRVESEISGVAPDDSDPDLSTISYDLDQLEIMEGDVIRSYKHRPNSSLNTLLTMLALLSLFMTIGIGIGHYLGTTREVTLRGQKGVRIKEIQDEYLQCLRNQDVLEAQITVTDEQKIAAVTAVWKQKYEEMIIENVELEHTMKQLQKQMSDGLHHAHSKLLVQQDEAKILDQDIDQMHQDELTEIEAKLDERTATLTQREALVAGIEALASQREAQNYEKEALLSKREKAFIWKEAEMNEKEINLNKKKTEIEVLAMQREAQNVQKEAEIEALATEREAQNIEKEAELSEREKAFITKETELNEKEIYLCEMETELLQATENEAKWTDTLLDIEERALELEAKEADLLRREALLDEEQAKVKVTDDVSADRLEDPLIEQQETDIPTNRVYVRPPLERQPNVQTEDSVDEDASLNELRYLQEQVNMLATENDDLRQQVALLRYSAYQQTDQQVSARGEITKELKQQANDLAHENVDLKSVVGKLRYSEPTEYNAMDAISELADDTSTGGDSETDMDPDAKPSYVTIPSMIYQPPEEGHEQIQPLDQHVPKLDGHTAQTPTGGEKPAVEAEPTVEPSGADPVPSVWSYLSLLVPDVDLSDLHKVISTEQLTNLTQPLLTQIQFIQNATGDVNFTETLSKKWEELRDIVGHENTDNVANKVNGIIGEMKNIFNSEYMDFKKYTNSEEFQEKKDAASEKIGSFVDKLSNLTVVARYQEFVNKTKDSVTKLSRKIKKTWHKVKNLTGDFLKKNKALNDFGDTITKSMKNIGKAVDSGWKKAQKHLKKKGLVSKPGGKAKKAKHRGKAWEGKKRYNGKIPQQQHTTFYENEKPDLPEEGKTFEKKPEHKNKESSSDYEKYEEYWKQAKFEPDDFLQEGFFEGNNRQWHKHQKRARKLQGRLQRLTEDIFLAMDDDDIEDIYEDFEDLQEDVDEMDQPEQLMTWLTCQVRWWKSRLFRKHSNEDLVKGCGRQMMQWQLTALCKPCSDHDVKCNRKLKGANVGPFCHYYQTVILPTTKQGLPEARGDCDDAVNPRKVLTVSLDSDQTNLEGEFQNQYGRLRYSMSLDDSELDQASKENSTEAEASAKWIFERAEHRESYHHDGSWMFKRGAKRDFQRNKPWYYERADERANHRSSRQHVEEDMNKHYKQHYRGRN